MPQRGDGGRASSAAAPDRCLLPLAWSLSSGMQTGLLPPVIHLRFWTSSKDWGKLAHCLYFTMGQSSNGYGVQSLGWDPIISPLLFKGSLFSLPRSYPLYSAGEHIDTLVFIERPAGMTGLVATDHATAVVSPFWEITYS